MAFMWVYLALSLWLSVFLSVSAAQNLPASISYKAPALFPESADWDRRYKRFIVGSLRRGILGVVKDSGKFSVFIRDKEYGGNRTQGVVVDLKRNRVVTTIFGGGATARPGGYYGAVAGYDLASKKRLFLIRLDTFGPQVPIGSFPNDVAVEPKTGDLWISDSYRALLWRVTRKKGKVYVIQNPVLDSGNATCPRATIIKLNGIVHRSSGYTLVGNTVTGNIIKVYRKKKNWEAVVVAGVNVPCVDGLRFRSDGALFAVTSAFVYLIKSSDDFKTAAIVEQIAQDPTRSATTAAVRNGRPYVTYAYFSLLGTSYSRWQLNGTIFSS